MCQNVYLKDLFKVYSSKTIFTPTVQHHEVPTQHSKSSKHVLFDFETHNSNSIWTVSYFSNL